MKSSLRQKFRRERERDGEKELIREREIRGEN